MPKALTKDLIKKISKEYGDSFYILDSDVFQNNCAEILAAFRKYYPKSNIAYSYKTNYTPKLAKIVDMIGGYAEVVSEMEMEVAIRSGVLPSHIIWNGPVKNISKVRELLISGGTVNIDSIYEMNNVRIIAEENPQCTLNVGVRINYNVGDGVLSRFGFDVDGSDFDKAMCIIRDTANMRLINLQVHFAKRLPEYWKARAEGMIKTYDKVVSQYGLSPERLDIGGGIYGDMPDMLREQLKLNKYSYDDYASRAAVAFAEKFKNDVNAPWLFIEPGTAVAADCMRYVARIETIKNVRGKTIATTNGSQKNISMNNLNPPMEVIDCGYERTEYKDLDIAGYTCIESDYLYRGYKGLLGVGDYVVYGCCGSYSIGMKPPFILPNVAVVDVSEDRIELIKKTETFDDLFQTFNF